MSHKPKAIKAAHPGLPGEETQRTKASSGEKFIDGWKLTAHRCAFAFVRALREILTTKYTKNRTKKNTGQLGESLLIAGAPSCMKLTVDISR
ncbi:MAG: hypothetical protein ACTHMM_09330 [Agriterribacter sp.]